MKSLMENITGESTVTISNSRFEDLIRESERLAIIKDFATANGYVSKDDLKTLLGIKEEGDDSCQQ